MTFYPGVAREVVGVVADVKLRGLSHREPIAALYVPNAQLPRTFTYLLVRTRQEPGSVARAVDAAVHAVDPEQPVVEVQTLEEHLRGSLAHARFNMLLLGAFASLALVLSAAGIYGVLAYGVRRRTREIGIRLALGARPTDVVRLIVAEGMRPTLLGLVLGLAGALALGRALASLVFEIRPADPTTLASVAALLGIVALAACALPAYRAARVDPTAALSES
jgi:ABC-type lipoprotein release transport system permease subunit